MTAYWIASYRSIADPDKVAAYAKLGAPAIEAAGGRFLARGPATAAFEAGATERTTLIAFDDVEQAVAAYHSEAYREALAALGDGAERDIRIIDGLD